MTVVIEWWPEWVSSALALGVATVCGLAILVTRRVAVRAVLAVLALEGVALAIVAPIVMPDMNGRITATAMSMSDDFLFADVRRETPALPRTFSFVRDVAVGAADGSTMRLSGNGGWNAATATAHGGGRYVVNDRNGVQTTQGTWRVTGFVSFVELPGSAELVTLDVDVDGAGAGVLTAWSVPSAAAKRALGRAGDGVLLTGEGMSFTDARVNAGRLEGAVTFTSADETRTR